jgi:hypothetical protein
MQRRHPVFVSYIDISTKFVHQARHQLEISLPNCIVQGSPATHVTLFDVSAKVIYEAPYHIDVTISNSCDERSVTITRAAVLVDVGTKLIH